MFGLFGKKTEREKLEAKYQQLLDESYKLSHTNRKASDEKAMQAEELRKKIDSLPGQ